MGGWGWQQAKLEVQVGVCCHQSVRPLVHTRLHLLQGIEERDGHPCNIEDLWLTDGASPAVHYMMKALLRDEQVPLGAAGWS